MRNVLIDVTRLLDRKIQGRLPTGIDRVSLEYLRHFCHRSSALVRWAGRWIELSPHDSERLYQILLTPNGNFANQIRWLVGKACWLSMDPRFHKPRFLFNTGHSGLEIPQYTKRVQNSALKPIFLVHDLIPILHPEFCRAGEPEKHQRRMKTLLGVGHGIIANSLHTLDQLHVYANANQLTVPPAVAALLAPAPLPTPDYAQPLNQPYFVMLGTIEPRKNHWMVLQIWRKLIEQYGKDTPKLVIIGQRGWESHAVNELLDNCAILKDYIVERPSCSDYELSTWLHHARALLFPSFAEGYGMPVVEALMHRLPVIASNLPAFKEFAGDVPEYVCPLDCSRWQELIIEYAKPDCLSRELQLHKLSAYKIPSWNTHFDQVEALMEQLGASCA